MRLPADLHTVYVPGIVNASQTYRIGQIFTEAVMKELRSRTNYRIVTTNDGTADATLSGMITSVYIAPLTYDSVTGRISSSMVVINLQASLTTRDGKCCGAIRISCTASSTRNRLTPTSFFEEAGPAVQRIASSFSKTLVANILEAF